MNRRSLVVRTARLLQRMPQSWARPLEAPLVRRGSSGQPWLIFLLALPRSGSTLTYQTLIHGLGPLYLSNLWNLFYGMPFLGGKLSLRCCRGYESDFQSSQGFVGGLCGPAEGLGFWSYWTGAGMSDASARVSEARLSRRVEYFRNVVRSLTSSEMPFVAGYLGHVLVAESLRAWFPDAIFIRLHRDPVSNAASILRIRQVGSGDWFSVRPIECESVQGKGLHEEVVAQVYWLNRRLAWLEQDDRTIHLSYEELSAKPDSTLQRIIDECNACGLELSLQKTLPSSFDYRVVSPDDDHDSARLSEELQRLEIEHGSISHRNSVRGN